MMPILDRALLYCHSGDVLGFDSHHDSGNLWGVLPHQNIGDAKAIIPIALLPCHRVTAWNRQASNLSKQVVDSDLEVLIEELKLIRDNVYGGLKKDSQIDLTHSEVISFARAFVMAVEAEMITPFSRWDNQKKEQVMFYINLIRTHGIPHCDRSRAAKKCLDFIDQQKKKSGYSEQSGYPE